MQPMNMIIINYKDKKFKKDCVLEANEITIKKNIDLMSLAQGRHFYRTCSKLPLLALFK